MNNFDWREYLQVARKIFNRCQNLPQIEMQDEALCRIGISRAYYAAFNSAKNLVEIDSLIGGAHEKVIAAFKAKGDKNYRQIASDLANLKAMRVKADYSGECYPARGFAGNAVAELQKALIYADNILKKI